MTLHDSSEPMTSSPSDDRLIDYLLGESIDECASGDALSDAEIEQWLAADQAHAGRLESLASAVLAVALPPRLAESTMGNAVSMGVPFSSCDDAHARRNTVEPAVCLANSGMLGLRTVAVGLLAVAAAISLAIFWSRTLAPEELSTQRLALAWAERFATTTSPLTSAGGELSVAGEISAGVELEDDWSGDWELAEADDWLASDEDEAFAAGNESPPQWLLTALAQMSSAPEFDSPEAEVIP